MSQTNTYVQGYSKNTLAGHQQRTATSDATFLLPYIRSTDHILDVGCGPGTITTGFAQYATEGKIVGLDISPTVLQTARELAHEAGVRTEGPGSVTFVEGNILERLDHPDESFDVVFANNVFGHIPPPELPVRALVELRRVLKTGGILATRDGVRQLFYPESLGLETLWRDNQARALGKGKVEPDPTGTRMPSFFARAGFDVEGGKVRVGAGASAASGEEVRMLAARTEKRLTVGDPFRQSWVDAGISEGEIEEMIAKSKEWANTEGAWFMGVSCEMLGWK